MFRAIIFQPREHLQLEIWETIWVSFKFIYNFSTLLNTPLQVSEPKMDTNTTNGLFFPLFALSNVISFLQQTERLSVILIVSLFGELDIYTFPTPRLKSNIY